MQGRSTGSPTCGPWGPVNQQVVVRRKAHRPWRDGVLSCASRSGRAQRTEKSPPAGCAGRGRCSTRAPPPAVWRAARQQFHQGIDTARRSRPPRWLRSPGRCGSGGEVVLTARPFAVDAVLRHEVVERIEVCAENRSDSLEPRPKPRWHSDSRNSPGRGSAGRARSKWHIAAGRRWTSANTLSVARLWSGTPCVRGVVEHHAAIRSRVVVRQTSCRRQKRAWFSVKAATATRRTRPTRRRAARAG